MKNSEFINKALEFILREWKDENISLEKVAEEAGFTLSYFDKMFKKNTGKSVMEYVRTYKLIRSAMLLRTTDKSILDIALEMNYENPENYARAFKAMYNMPPSEYREKHKNVPLEWKDSSTGAVIHRFEKHFPEIERVDTEELKDRLLKSPLKYAYNICFMDEIDCAVYRLDESEYIYVEEFQADAISLTLYCKDENIRKYLDKIKTLPKYEAGIICDCDFELPEDLYGFAKCDKRYDYAYLKDNVEIISINGYTIREVVESDRTAVEKFSKKVNPIIFKVFEQKFTHSNYGGTEPFGMFLNDGSLAGYAMPSLEYGTGTVISDIGGIFMDTEYDNEENVRFIWSHIIDWALKMNAIPVNGGVSEETTKTTDKETSEKMGYTLIAKRYNFTHGLD